MAKRFKWNAHTDGLLRTYAEAGHSSASAARLIGCDRNAAQHRARVLGCAFKADAGRVAKPRAPKPAKANARPKPVPFLEAGAHQCAWPMVKRDAPGHAHMLVCGAPIARGSYCAGHDRRAHRLTYSQGFEGAMAAQGWDEVSL